MPWKAIACSEIGTSHQKLELPCQDYVGFIRLNNGGEISDNGDIVIGAVSDGAGSCKYSDVGSKLAVETTLEFLQPWLKWLKEKQKDSSPEILKESAKKAFAKTLREVKEAFDEKARKMSCSPKDFACTLLVVVSTPDWLAAMQIGDGFIVIRKPESEYQLLFHPSKGEYANQTTFVTTSDALEKMQVKTLFGKQKFICAASDGLERIAINLKYFRPHPPFFEMFEKALEERTEEQEKSSTQEWLNSEAVNERTDDDKTILLFWHEDSETEINPSPFFTVISMNVLSGIFWNSLYHDLFVDIKIQSSALKWILSLFIAALLTTIIIRVNLYMYKPHFKYSESQSQKVKLLIYLLITSCVSLGLGGLFYYSIRQFIWYFSKL